MRTDAGATPAPADINLARRFGDAVRARGWTCATAESCTGGWISLTITSIAGSSDYMLGGVIAYSNEMKRSTLQVPNETLASVGAVSAECALAMARGVQRFAGSDVGVSSTGIAGPGGATARKPVGLVYVSVATPSGERVAELRLQGDRAAVMRQATSAALELAITLMGEPALVREGA